MLFKKSIERLVSENEQNDGAGLKRSLGPINLVALGIGAIVGAGIFSLTGIVAAENAGPAVILSFILAAVACAFCALCYAEYASMIPVAGSAYTYTYATMGEFMAWIIGWDLVLEYALASATVAVSWSSYATKLLAQLHVNLPPELTSSPFDPVKLADGSTLAGGIVNLPAIVIVALLSLVLAKGTKESATMNNLLVLLKLSVIVLFIVLGWSFIQEENYHPFIPENTGEFGHFGWSGIVRGAAVVFFGFIGFDAVSTAAQESKNPQKDMPIGIIGSLLVATVLYVAFSYVMTGMVSYKTFIGDASPAATAFAVTGYHFLNSALIIAILAGYTSVILVMLMGQSRVFYSMSKDGLLPSFFSDIHSKFKTPWKSNLFFMVFVSILAGFVPISDLGHMVSIGTLFAFSLVSLGIIILRKTSPDVKRGFRVPFVPFVPILGIGVCVFLMTGLPLESWERLFIWMAIGVVFYFLYGKRHSKLRKENEELKK
ncbi:amino acid permease [Flavobacterium aquidurense]|uniref:amino acid permease n=1 Tax=Flavobacterium aquidurense TaxID=362413 RepID=UPI0009182229|nr:amino acid permease [Flavobacterium aquidurense]OXA67808.1 amino acid transporter [Flavobacterium aquidurense]SHF96789.1 amino acid/polyamine/organocation transporter, APC superfamily [Flavobacterium frigidimaris]